MRVRLPIVFILMFLFLSGCTKKNSSQIPERVSPNNNNVAEVISVEKHGDKAANFTWQDESGRMMSLDSLRGNVVVLNFWATWCGPCKNELPELVELSKTFANRNVRFIGVSMDRGPNIIEDVRSFVREQGIPYQNVLATDELTEAYDNVHLLPTSFLISPEGKIAQTFVGIRSKEVFSSSIASLLK